MTGENIPLEGRIVAVADVFDALTSQRPYKPAWTIEATMELFESEAGKHFDPKLVAEFKQILPQVIEIRDTHLEY